MKQGQDYVPVLPSQHQSSSPSSASSPRGVFSSGSTTNGSIGSFTSYSSGGSGSVASNHFGSRNESPEIASSQRQSYPVHYSQPAAGPTHQQPYGYTTPASSHSYNNMMNATQAYNSSHAHHGYMDSHPPHLGSSGHAPVSAPPPYSHYHQPASLIQNYGPTVHPQYSYPSYPHAVTSSAPQHSHYSHQTMLPAMSSAVTGPTGAPDYPQQQDTTGQVAPPGVRPKVTATLWEDEGTLCFQVEVQGICVARREDNHMINGTKLLNVAGMTRGRRDGILKSEKNRNVVKIGPMHLKGVWIPFERALEFANKEKMTERLYPLFVHNIRALLQTIPPSQPGGSRRNDSQQGNNGSSNNSNNIVTTPQQYPRTTSAVSATQPATLQHSSSVPSSNTAQSHLQTTPVAQTAGGGRPGLDRAHTFPTPPTSATSVVNAPNHSGSSYDWSTPGVPMPAQLPVDHSNPPRSMPTPPASTPPEQSLTTMHHFQSHQSYDTPRAVYTAPPSQQPPYGTASTYSYMKNDMGPPVRSGATEHGSSVVKDDPSSEHDYTSNSTHYGAPDRSYAGYNPAPPAIIPSQTDRTLLSNDPSKDSPTPHSNSGRGTPRSTLSSAQQQPQPPAWPSSYNTQAGRGGPNQISSMQYIMADNRSNGMTGASTNGYMAGADPSGPSQSFVYPSNGASNKRMREVEDEADPYMRPSSTGTDSDPNAKRRKTTREGSAGLTPMGNGALNRPIATAHAPSQRR